MKDFFRKNRKTVNLLLRVLKWILLLVFLYFAFRHINFDEMRSSIKQFSFQSIFFFLVILLTSRIVYAWRWKVIGRSLLSGEDISTYYYFQANTLAEFVSIVLPSSVSGEVVRVFKLNSRGNKTAQSTAVILIDRASGIIGMILVSVSALLLMGRNIELTISDLIPGNLLLPLGLSVGGLILIGIFVFFKLMQKEQFSSGIKSAWQILTANIYPLLVSLLISCAAHIIFSLSHIFIFNEVFPLNPVELTAVILTPQLARMVPISVLGFSPGEGMMVASQMMAGISRETAVLITLITLISRYFFALIGFVLEILTDGLGFLKKTSESKDIDTAGE